MISSKLPAQKPKKVIYLGNMTSIAAVLAARADMELAGWVAEKEDLADPIFKVYAEKSEIPFYAVAGGEDLSVILKKIPKFDLGIIANFGLLLTPEDLKSTKGGFVNIHLGLLPENPGRHPIQRVIRGVEEISGVTLHRVVEKADAGPVIERRATAMPKERDATQLFMKLELLACRMLDERMEELLK